MENVQCCWQLGLMLLIVYQNWKFTSFFIFIQLKYPIHTIYFWRKKIVHPRVNSMLYDSIQLLSSSIPILCVDNPKKRNLFFPLVKMFISPIGTPFALWIWLTWHAFSKHSSYNIIILNIELFPLALVIKSFSIVSEDNWSRLWSIFSRKRCFTMRYACRINAVVIGRFRILFAVGIYFA